MQYYHYILWNNDGDSTSLIWSPRDGGGEGGWRCTRTQGYRDLRLLESENNVVFLIVKSQKHLTDIVGTKETAGSEPNWRQIHTTDNTNFFRNFTQRSTKWKNHVLELYSRSDNYMTWKLSVKVKKRVDVKLNSYTLSRYSVNHCSVKDFELIPPPEYTVRFNVLKY